MEDDARRCALPGCDVTIEDIPGRPARRYCTAAHRAAARQARRASMQPDQERRLAETLPWLREPDPDPVRARGAVTALPRPLPRSAPPPAPPAAVPGRRGGLVARLGERLPRRRGAIAVIGAAGILAGGYTVTSSQIMEQAGPTQATPQGETSDGWAARAQVTLTSVDRQLDTIAQTEAAWNSMPDHETLGTPVPVAEMMNRKALLERRKAALQSQLDNYRALSRARADLEIAERNLAAVERALQDTPTTGAASSPDQESALAALEEQRDLRLRQRDAKKLELAALEGNVEKAAHAPLPDDGEQTSAVSNEVMDVIHRGGRGGGPTDPSTVPPRPELVSGGREGQPGKERQATTTSAPPDPRGPRDESAVRPSGPGPKGEDHKGPVSAVVDTVGGAVDGLTGAKDHGATGNGRKDAGKGGGGLVGAVGDTVGGAVDGLTGSKDSGAKDGGPADSGPKGNGSTGNGRKDAGKGGGGLVGAVGDTVGGTVGGLTGSADGGSGAGASARSAPRSPAPAPQASGPGGTAPAASPRTAAPAASPRTAAPAATPAAPVSGQNAAAGPATEMAMAIVHSVPGGEVAAPAVEAAMRQATTPAASNPSSPKPSGTDAGARRTTSAAPAASSAGTSTTSSHSGTATQAGSRPAGGQDPAKATAPADSGPPTGTSSSASRTVTSYSSSTWGTWPSSSTPAASGTSDASGSSATSDATGPDSP